MTDSGKQRPRRAFSVDDAQPDGVDDTRSEATGRARRGAADDFNSPFARPTDSPRDTVVPAPVLPGAERRPARGSGPGRRGRWDGLSDETTPVERGSASETAIHAALSPTPPSRASRQAPSWDWPEQRTSQPAPAPAAAPRSPARAAGPVPEAEPDPSLPGREQAAQPGAGSSGGWVAHHRRILTTWVVAAVAAAVLIAGGLYVFSRFNGLGAASTNTTPSTGSSSEPVNVTESSLVDTSDAALIDSSASWSITKNILEKDKNKLTQATCQGSDSPDINTTATMQRAIGTDQQDQLALVHQIDAYANEDAAKKIYEQRVAALASCTALITGASTVSGLGDDVTQVSLANENDPVHYHTVLMVRTGRVLNLLDVVRTGSTISPDVVAAALTRPLGTICETSQGTCPSTPQVTPAAPPATSPPGWLSPSDLPRITVGHGLWKETQPSEVSSSAGMGCEGIPLATEPGPSARQQRTYVINSDDATPKGFGVTQYHFTFADEAAATTFGDQLSEHLASCAKTSVTATVKELSAVTTDGSDGPAVASRLFNIAQKTSDEASTQYQLIVARSGTTVNYLLVNNTSDSYQFTEDHLRGLALRLGQRASQG